VKPGDGRPERIGRRRLLALTAGASVLTCLRPAITPALAQDTKVIRLGAGPTGATEFLMGGLVANAISNPPGSRECDRGGNCGVPGLIAVAQTTGGAVENLKAIAKGDLEFGLAQADVASWLYGSSGPFAGQPALKNLRAIARLYPATIHLLVRKDSKINAVTDLRNRKVGVGLDGSAQAATARMVLTAYNMRFKVQLRPLAFTAMTDALGTGAVDALFFVSGAPALALEDLARQTPVRVIPITGPIANKLVNMVPYYTPGVVPAGTYGQAQDVPTLDVGIMLVARDSMDDDLGFGIARAIWHERNEALFANGHPCGKLMSKDLAAKGFAMPLHGGAARYYIGRGIEVPQQNAPVASTPTRAAAATIRSL
jgi:TRAP transporter TAXI family solute receptor